jgi:hypothetical protein
MENTAQALKEARPMIATLKKERRKDKAKIQELTEIIQEQNCLFFFERKLWGSAPGNRENILKKRKQSYKEGLTSGPTSGWATRRD